MRKVKKTSFVRHEHFGKLQVIASFRDSTGTVWVGINGKDGVEYQFNASECVVISREEFDRE